MKQWLRDLGKWRVRKFDGSLWRYRLQLRFEWHPVIWGFGVYLQAGTTYTHETIVDLGKVSLHFLALNIVLKWWKKK